MEIFSTVYYKRNNGLIKKFNIHCKLLLNLWLKWPQLVYLFWGGSPGWLSHRAGLSWRKVHVQLQPAAGRDYKLVLISMYRKQARSHEHRTKTQLASHTCKSDIWKTILIIFSKDNCTFHLELRTKLQKQIYQPHLQLSPIQ